MNKKTISSFHIFFNTSKDILIWDGNCKFCQKCIDWLISRGGDEKLFLVPFQQIPYPPMNGEFEKECIQSIQFLKSTHEIFTGGDAFIEILFAVGYNKIARIMTKPILKNIINNLYFFMAKNRIFLSRFIKRK